jgi:4-amino-4-deoxy-L-arabinose transferase-like glycosyltransferase
VTGTPLRSDAVHVDEAADAARSDDGADEPRDFTWWVALAVVAAGALAVRVAFVLITQAHVTLAGDAYWYHWQARLVADGRGFLNPYDFYKHGLVTQGADHPPAFIVLLTLADWVGISTDQGQRLLMCVVGTASVVVIAVVVKHLVGRRAALVAAVLAALYPNLWINDGMLMSETLYIFFVALSFLFAYRFWRRPRWGSLVGLSVSLAIMALTRPESVLLFVFFLVPFVLVRRQVAWRLRLGYIAGAAGIAVVLLAPWIGYNLSRYTNPVYLSSGFGQTLAVGNCNSTYSGPFLGFYDITCLQPPKVTPPTEGDASVRDVVWRKIGTTYIKGHLSDLPKVIAAREGRIWGVYRVHQQETLDWFVEGRGTRTHVEWAQWSYWALLPFAALGVYALRRRRLPTSPLLAQFALVAFVAALTFGVTRYRAGAEVGLVIFAAAGVELLVSWVSARVRTRGGPAAHPDEATEPDPSDEVMLHGAT